MKIFKPRTFVIFALAGLLGAALLHTSQNVQRAGERLRVMEISVLRDQEKTRTLRAEWESLNSPERLEELAESFLDLLPPSSDQMALESSALPDAQPVGFEAEQSAAPVLQPVSLGGRVAPSPLRKPAQKIKQKPRAEKAKSFDALIGELGGEQ